MEIVGVSSPIANAALVAEGGDVNNASSVLLEEREKSDARGSVQRMQAGIEEEAANVVKKVGGPGTSPPYSTRGRVIIISAFVPVPRWVLRLRRIPRSTSRAAGRRRRKAINNSGHCITAETVVVDLVPLHLTMWSDQDSLVGK